MLDACRCLHAMPVSAVTDMVPAQKPGRRVASHCEFSFPQTIEALRSIGALLPLESQHDSYCMLACHICLPPLLRRDPPIDHHKPSWHALRNYSIHMALAALVQRLERSHSTHAPPDQHGTETVHFETT